ncbi:hypothetical protein BDA96_05G054500 [Sorghum bicolor]|uniref:Uncharacterized protein n=1 Tax=Sorghum bicolor TaxID=4558 RepID=A0A921QWJ8_SORBI|nr:hypothetical protein BDA96_05G054500 [Sorghum bicolor]
MVVLYANILGGLQSNSCNILYLHIEKNIFAGYVEHSIKRRKNLFFCQPEHLLLLQVFKVFTWKETVSISVAKIHGHKQV